MRNGFLLFSLLLMTCAVHAQQHTITYVYTDAQGTPLAEADANGNIIARFDYTPYGVPAPGMGPAPNGPGYTGHVNDPDTGLVYMQARYYDPAVGRFLSADPVASAPGNLFNFNRYNYTSNNPITYTDPDGRCSDADGSCSRMVAVQGAYAAAHPNEPLSPVAKIGLGAMLTASGAGAVVEVTGMVKSAIMIDKVLLNSSSTPKLTSEQSRNLARFEKKFSKENRNVQVSHGKDGTITMKNDVPGKVPGSKAVYEKTVDSAGRTTSAIKTTYDPKGEVVHVKDKLNQ